MRDERLDTMLGQSQDRPRRMRVAAKRQSRKSTKLMHNLDDVTRLPDDFDGRVRLFPLPQMVLFPHAMQPLHLFEPRYCEMLAESLDSDQLIAMATYEEADSSLMLGHSAASLPSISPFVCIGKIITHSELENDRHNILLVGAKRAQIVNELDVGRSFRIAKVEVIDDFYSPARAESRPQLKQLLLQAFGEVIPASPTVKANLHELMAGQMGLGPITDIISYTLPFDTPDKLELLSVSDVDERAEMLIQMLQSGKVQLHSVSNEDQQSDPSDASEERFPPPFSVN